MFGCLWNCLDMTFVGFLHSNFCARGAEEGKAAVADNWGIRFWVVGWVDEQNSQFEEFLISKINLMKYPRDFTKSDFHIRLCSPWPFSASFLSPYLKSCWALMQFSHNSSNAIQNCTWAFTLENISLARHVTGNLKRRRRRSELMVERKSLLWFHSEASNDYLTVLWWTPFIHAHRHYRVTKARCLFVKRTVVGCEWWAKPREEQHEQEEW